MHQNKRKESEEKNVQQKQRAAGSCVQKKGADSGS